MPLRVTIVGPGRLGRSAAQILHDQGAEFVLVGRGEAIPRADVTWLTVPDREIAAAAGSVPAGGTLLHASGAEDYEILRPHPCIGSLHPLMSFPGPEVGLPNTRVPAAIDGDDLAITDAHRLASTLGFDAVRVPGSRALYHAAAVTAGNFGTVLLVKASQILVASGMSEADARALLGPLAITSLKNAVEHGAAALTGPIVRGDDDVVAKHAEAIRRVDPELSALYESLSAAARSLTEKN